MKELVLIAHLAITSFLLANSPSASEYKSDLFIQNKDLNILKINKSTPTIVELIDGVEDGCWTNIQQVKTEIEFVLNESGFSITDSRDDVLSQFMQFNVLGYKTSNGLCVVSYRLAFYTFDFQERIYSGHRVQNLKTAVVWRQNGVSSGPGPLNDSLGTTAANMTKKFVIDLRKSKDSLISTISEEARENNLPEAAHFWATFE